MAGVLDRRGVVRSGRQLQPRALERHKLRPLAHATAIKLRKYHAAGHRVSDIALAFGVRRETVSNVVNGKTHKREHDLPKLQTPEQRAAKYDRALRKALELRGRRRR